MEKRFETLSRGERQRLAMIAVTARRPLLYLLDEITSALNRELHDRVIDHFDQCGATVIAVSHDPRWKHLSSFKTHLLRALDR